MTIISIGPNCYNARMLNKHGLRTQAFPFDHNLSSIKIVQHAISDRFNVFLNPDYWTQTEFSKKSTHHSLYGSWLVSKTLTDHVKAMLENPARKYLESMTDFSKIDMFFHYDMLHNETHITQMQRRCQRFLNLWDSNDPIVLVYYNQYDSDWEELATFASSITRRNTHIVGIYNLPDQQKNTTKLETHNLTIVCWPDDISKLIRRCEEGPTLKSEVTHK